jgi:UPF0716 protein FxsA
MAIMVKWFLAAVAALVIAELAAFIAVAEVLGLPQAFILMFATSFVGIAVLRHPGRSRINRLHEAMTKKGISGLEAGGDAFLTVSAGVLLLVPGFITDAVGVLLLLPPVRSWIGGRFRSFLQTKPPDRPGVVDLEPDQWNRLPDRQIDQHRPNDRP